MSESEHMMEATDEFDYNTFKNHLKKPKTKRIEVEKCYRIDYYCYLDHNEYPDCDSFDGENCEVRSNASDDVQRLKENMVQVNRFSQSAIGMASTNTLEIKK